MDTDNPVNRAYLSKHQTKMQLDAQSAPVANPASPEPAAKAPKAAAPLPINDDFGTTEGLSEIMQTMTLKQLTTRYGGIPGVERFAKILQTLAVTSEKEQRIQERRQELIPKDFVTARLFGYVDQLMNKLLDWPEGAVDTIIAKVLSNQQECRGELVNYMKDNLSRCICDAKSHITSELTSLRGKYDTKSSELEELKDVVENLKSEQ